MTNGRAALLSALLLIGNHNAASGDNVSPRTYRLGDGSATIIGESRTGPYPLPHRTILFSTEHLTLRGITLVSEEDYWLRRDLGEVTFSQSLSPADTVYVLYRYFPLELPAERFLHRLRMAGDDKLAVLEHVSPFLQMSGPLDRGSLRVGGSKSFAVLIGSGQELKLEQALRVSVNGNLTPDIKVTARLSDENLPFQPDGRSERLEELDEVLIRIESPTAEATLGDYTVQFDQSEFGAYERVLQGALGRYKREHFDFEVSGGAARGEFLSIEIRGAEGKQGPYELFEPDGSLVVIAGSETIWLEGERLVRGEENDYVIDYDRGTITLTPSRPVHSETRLAADFQVSGEEYKRSFFTNRFELRTGDGRFRFGGTLLSERDDDNSPEAFTLNEEDLDSLAASGDRRAFVPSARVVEEGGDYDTTGGHFVFAGPGRGEFRVTFRVKGMGDGSYVKEIDPAWAVESFRFVGAGAGDYEPIILLPLPSSHDLFALRGEARPLPALRIGGELAWSDRDENVLSSIDDDDNSGTGAKAELHLAPVAPWGDGVYGKVSLDATLRHVGDHFQTLGRSRNPHRDAKWMTPALRSVLTQERTESDRLGIGEALSVAEGETMGEASLRWNRKLSLTALQVWGEGGFLERGFFDADRWSGGGSWAGESRHSLRYREERVSTHDDSASGVDGTTTIRQVDGWVRVGRFKPIANRSTEERAFERAGSLISGVRSEGERVGLLIDEGGAFETEFGVLFEDRDFVDSVASDWAPWYEGQTEELRLRWRSAVSLEGLYRHRAIDYSGQADRGNESSDLGRVSVRHGGFGGALRGTWNYQVSSEERRRIERVFRRPTDPEAEADYDSLGNFFPDEGTHNLILVERDPEAVVDLEVSGSIRLEPRRRRGSELGRFWEGLRFDTFLRARELSNTTDRSDLLLLNPRAFQRDATTLEGTILIRQEFRWTDRETSGSVQIRWQREDRERNDFENTRREDLIHTILVRGKVPLGDRFTGELEWNRRLEEEWANDDRAVDLVSDDGEGSIVYQPDPRWRFRLPVAYRVEQENVRVDRIESIRLAPEATVNLSRRGRLDANLSWTQFLSEELDRSASFLRSRKEGIRWRSQFAYEWNQVLRSSISYVGDNLKGKSAEHRFRAEMRAFF